YSSVPVWLMANSLHPWNGLDGDRALKYEGFINNAHWWKITLDSPPAAFQFCFRTAANAGVFHG
ncbi:MAG TPA: hypothetical protein PLM52_16755, partial [Tabrizicola sp.]|nr:hypothetical protein [Tabrizicola sp.]